MPALARTDVDNLLYPRVTQGTVRLRVANESLETDYLDYLAVLAVERHHRRGTSVVPDGEGPTPQPGRSSSAGRGCGLRGREVLARFRRSDGWAWESNPTGRDSSRAADVRDGIESSFRRPPGVTSARLLVDASNTAGLSSHDGFDSWRCTAPPHRPGTTRWPLIGGWQGGLGQRTARVGPVALAGGPSQCRSSRVASLPQNRPG